MRPTRRFVDGVSVPAAGLLLTVAAAARRQSLGVHPVSLWLLSLGAGPASSDGVSPSFQTRRSIGQGRPTARKGRELRPHLRWVAATTPPEYHERQHQLSPLISCCLRKALSPLSPHPQGAPTIGMDETAAASCQPN